MAIWRSLRVWCLLALKYMNQRALTLDTPLLYCKDIQYMHLMAYLQVIKSIYNSSSTEFKYDKIIICVINSLRLIDTYRIYASGNKVIGSYNSSPLLQYQAITWSNADTLSNGPLGTNLSETWIKTQQFPFEKIKLKILLAKWWPFCISPNMFFHCEDIFGVFIVHLAKC